MRMLLSISLILFFWSCDLTAQESNGAPIKLRVATYNVGHFNQGELGGFQGRHANPEMLKWKAWIGEQSIDILGLNEWNKHFDKDSVFNAEENILSGYYNNIYFGDQNTWIYNGIATNYTLTNLRQKYSHGDYYALLGDLKIGDITVTVISTHIPWQKQWHTSALESLISDLKQYEYFICLGDINAIDEEQLNFKKAGFNIANGGNQGWFCTAPSGELAGKKDGIHIDNIITSKNIKIMKVSAPFTGLNDQDHLPVISDIIITN